MEPANVEIDKIDMSSNAIKNFTQKSLCLNEENNINYHFIPSVLDLGDNYLDCRFFCNLYMQLRLERPLKIRFNSNCSQNLGLLKANSPNKELIEFFSKNQYLSSQMIDFKESMCEFYEYYSCNYSGKYLGDLRNEKFANTNKKTMSLKVFSFYFIIIFTIIAFTTYIVFEILPIFNKPKKIT